MGCLAVLTLLRLSQDKPGKESNQASDPALGAALWNLSEKIIKDKLGEDALVDWNLSKD
jgi:hypothetical protein